MDCKVFQKTLDDYLDGELPPAMQAAFARMNLVTREEFDIQAGVLARTRQKLEALEKQVAELEKQLSQK